MSSLFNNDTMFNGSNAVDGAYSSNCKFGGCAFTGVNTTSPSMVLTLSLPAFVYRFVFHSGLYANGSTTYIQLWINFTAYNSEGLHTVAGRGEKAFIKTLSIYTGEIFEPIKTVIISDDNTTDGTFIILQEVELFGETVCPIGTYGLGCLQTCNCAVRGESCLVSTGGCPSGCPVGLRGVDCKETCDPGYYGTSCLLPCSNNCSNQLCNQTTGHCFRCHPGYYGDTCELKCSDNCAGDRMCDVNGTCLYGCSDGYHGDRCLDGGLPFTTCDVMKFGPSCTQTCSPNCKPVEPAGSTTCHFVTGACLLGCRNGYLEPTCSEAPESTSHVVNIIIGVGVVVVLVVLIVVVGCVVYRRLRHVREDVGSSNNNPTTTGFDKPDFTMYNGRGDISQEYYRKGGLPQQIYTQRLSVNKTSEEEIYDCIQYDSNSSSVVF
ncbi:delta-like protein 4 [Physella acuta]|uniref:delta-like protein 4 n=1 Tax=Physella acuta TaxID=109671 RepID=UPI0027DD8F72|nr:delta-like protein 4 [Physella acuta]